MFHALDQFPRRIIADRLVNLFALMISNDFDYLGHSSEAVFENVQLSASLQHKTRYKSVEGDIYASTQNVSRNLMNVSDPIAGR